MEWNNVWNCLMGISAPVSAFGMIVITFVVYKLNNKSSKKENYLRYMVELYHMIEDDAKVLATLGCEKSSSNDSDFLVLQSRRRIIVNSTLMISYLLRIPGYYDDRLKFMGLLYDISNEPNNLDNYSLLSNKFKEFVWELRDKNKKSLRMPVKYDGQPL